MADDKQQQEKPDVKRPSLTSPIDGRTDRATKPPGQGEVDREAVEKGWAALDRAGGGH